MPTTKKIPVRATAPQSVKIVEPPKPKYDEKLEASYQKAMEKIEKSKKEPKKKKTEKEDTSKKITIPVNEAIPTRMSKEERDSILEELLQPPHQDPSNYRYTIEETEFEAKEWVVVLTPQGLIYQEPVPRYFDYQTFVAILASIPDKPLSTVRTIDYEATFYTTTFDVKGLNCVIITCDHNGSRALNPYADLFDLKTGTQKVGGNLVFASAEKPFTKKDVKVIIQSIIKYLDLKEEVITWK